MLCEPLHCMRSIAMLCRPLALHGEHCYAMQTPCTVWDHCYAIWTTCTVREALLCYVNLLHCARSIVMLCERLALCEEHCYAMWTPCTVRGALLCYVNPLHCARSIVMLCESLALCEEHCYAMWTPCTMRASLCYVYNLRAVVVGSKLLQQKCLIGKPHPTKHICKGLFIRNVFINKMVYKSIKIGYYFI